jgi:SAM-dependent methyltransferase
MPQEPAGPNPFRIARPLALLGALLACCAQNGWAGVFDREYADPAPWAATDTGVYTASPHRFDAPAVKEMGFVPGILLTERFRRIYQRSDELRSSGSLSPQEIVSRVNESVSKEVAELVANHQVPTELAEMTRNILSQWNDKDASSASGATSSTLLTKNSMGAHHYSPSAFVELALAEIKENAWKKQRAGGMTPFRVFEMGGAYGYHSASLVGPGSARTEVYYNDMEPRHAALAARMQWSNPERGGHWFVNVSKVPNCTLPADSFDAATAFLVLHFMSGSEIERTLDQLYASLVPGGRVYLQATAPTNIMAFNGERKAAIAAKLKEWSHLEGQKPWLYLPDLPEFADLLKGYQIVHPQYRGCLDKAAEKAGFEIVKDMYEISKNDRGELEDLGERPGWVYCLILRRPANEGKD